MFPSYRNQSIDLLCKFDWLYFHSRPFSGNPQVQCPEKQLVLDIYIMEIGEILFTKIVDEFQLRNIFIRVLHWRCLTEFLRLDLYQPILISTTFRVNVYVFSTLLVWQSATLHVSLLHLIDIWYQFKSEPYETWRR